MATPETDSPLPADKRNPDSAPAAESPSAGGSKRLPRAERERQMLEAAAQLFGEKGYDATSMDDVAQACGVTKPMVYSYFESKEGLYNAMLQRAGIRLMTEFASVLDPQDPHKTMRLATRAFLDFVQKFSGSWRMVFSTPPHEGREMGTIQAYRAQIMKSMCHIIVKLNPANPRSPEALAAAEPYAYAWLGCCEQVSQWWLSTPGKTRADAEATLTVLLESYLQTLSGHSFGG